jgi:hypothetical protein
MRHFIVGLLTPCQACWKIVSHDIISHNDEAPCAALLDFLCLACTCNSAGDTALPLAWPKLIVPLADTLLVHHQAKIIVCKLPGLNHAPVLAAGQQVAQSLGKLVAEQGAARQDILNPHNNITLKTIMEYLGASTHTLLWVCQVPNPAALPPVYQTMANNGKKKEHITMQRAIDDMMNQMGFAQLHFAVIVNLAAKLSPLTGLELLSPSFLHW